MRDVRPYLALFAGLVTGILVLLYGVALFLGRASMPPEIQTALIGVIVTASTVFGVYMNARNANRQAELSRAHSDANAQQTQSKVQEGLDVMNDGMPAKIAAGVSNTVARTAEGVAERLRIREQEEALLALSAKLDLFLASQSGQVAAPVVAAPVVPVATPVVPVEPVAQVVPVDVPAPPPQVVQEHTAAVQRDTEAMRAHTEVLKP